jgi:N-acyl-D-aspartate/D-glutamate deacylase
LLQAIPATGKASIPGIDSDDGSIADEIRMLGRVSRAAGVRVTFTTAQHAGEPDAWRDLLGIAAEENAEGGQLSPMVLPRGATVLTTLGGYHLFMLRPTYRRLAHLPHEALVRELRRPEIREAILSEKNELSGRPGAMLNVLPPLFENSFDRTFPLTYPVEYEPVVEASIARRAAAQGCSPAEFLYDFLLEDGGRSVAMLLAANYVDGDLSVCRDMLTDPNSVSGLSDAGAHVNFVCDMSAPTFHLTHWVRGRTRGPTLPVETVVRKITADPARIFGLHDRGRIAVGLRADLNVIDLERLEILSPALHRDLPAGGSRFLQPSRGYIATTVAGVLTRRSDQDTGERPGRLARPAAPGERGMSR